MIVGLCGKKRSGKSSVAKYLVEEKGFYEISWAFPLKEIIGRELFGLNDDQLYGPEVAREAVIPEWGMSPRQILQLVGTECFRKVIRDDFWVVLGKKRLKEFADRNWNVVISDCRFPNEMEALRELGGITVRIVRNDQISTDPHPSENSLDEYKTDYTLTAESGHLASLFRQIERVIEHAN